MTRTFIAKGNDTYLSNLLAPFSSIEHLHLDMNALESFDIPHDVEIRGWHVRVGCGWRVFRELVKYVEAGHKLDTLNIFGAPDPRGSPKKVIREALSATMKDLRFLGISPVILTRDDRETGAIILELVAHSILTTSNHSASMGFCRAYPPPTHEAPRAPSSF